MSITIKFKPSLTNELVIRTIRDLLYGKSLEKIRCPYCGSRDVIKYGKVEREYTINRYKCKNCGRTFSDLTGTPFESSKLNTVEIFLICFLYFKLGFKISQISKAIKKPYRTVWNVIKKSQRGSPLFLKNLFDSLAYELIIDV